jgi:hypothetical protein
MPTTIYDSSMITQRIQNKTIADSFIGRIQRQTNPTTGSAPSLGITSASIINSVEEGQMQDIKKIAGCTIINAGCPCAITVPNTIAPINNDIIITLPGAPSNITATYGSVIVTWTAPIVGVEVQPFTYELTTTPLTLTTTIPNGITTYTYTTPLAPLTPGTNYTFNVRAINSAGAGPFASSVGNFYAPYPAPTGILVADIQYNGANISFNNYTSNFIPIASSSILYTDQGNFSGTIFIDSPGADALTVMGLSPSTTYTNCYLVLINGNNRSDKSALFSFTTQISPPAPTGATQNFPGSQSPGSALIDLDYYSYHNPSFCRLNIPTQGIYPVVDYQNQDQDSYARFGSLPSGTWNDCTLTLEWSGIDGSTIITPSSNTFTLNIM